MPMPQQIRSTRILLRHPKRSFGRQSGSRGVPLKKPPIVQETPFFKMKCQSRNQRIELRVSQIELLALQDRADQTGKTLSAYLRTQGLLRPIQQRRGEVSIKTYTELGRIGNNINQLTHLAHLAQLSGNGSLQDWQGLVELNNLLHQVRREIAVGSLEDDDDEVNEDDWQTD